MIGGEIGITPIVNRASLVLGYAGVYSSFLRHAENASKRYGIPASKILEAVGERKAVGGQEDIIIECAIELQKTHGAQGGSRGARPRARRRATRNGGRLVTAVASPSIDSALTELAAAALERREIEPLTDTWPALDERTAYAIQERLVAKQIADERTRLIGRKLG